MMSHHCMTRHELRKGRLNEFLTESMRSKNHDGQKDTNWIQLFNDFQKAIDLEIEERQIIKI